MHQVLPRQGKTQIAVVNQYLHVLGIDGCIDALLVTFLVLEDAAGAHVAHHIVCGFPCFRQVADFVRQ